MKEETELEENKRVVLESLTVHKYQLIKEFETLTRENVELKKKTKDNMERMNKIMAQVEEINVVDERFRRFYNTNKQSTKHEPKKKTKNAKTIAQDYIIKNIDKTKYLSFKKIAEKTGVSLSTASRAARELAREITSPYFIAKNKGLLIGIYVD